MSGPRLRILQAVAKWSRNIDRGKIILMRTSGGLVRRPSIRLKDFDYSGPASFFITICTADRRCTLGAVHEDSVILTSDGEVVREQWLISSSVRPGVILDEFVIMPNHLHAILFIPSPPEESSGARCAPLQRKRRSLGALVGGFKSRVTSILRKNHCNPMLSPWQVGFHDEIIWNSRKLDRLREYVRQNPARWPEDSYFAVHADRL